MSTTFVVADILADAANLSNCPPFSATTRITLSQATYWLAQSARSLSALLRQNRAEDRDMLRITPVSTQASVGYVSLPTDCGEVHALIWTRGSNDDVLLEHAQQEDLPAALATPGWSSAGIVPTWRLEGATIALYPPSAAVEALTVYHTVHVVTSSASFQANLDFDRWVTLDLCVKVANAKNKQDVAVAFAQQRLLLESEMLSRARKRDVNAVHTIRDVRPARFGRDPWWNQ